PANNINYSLGKASIAGTLNRCRSNHELFMATLLSIDFQTG
ncbi:MAG: hypothetical protein ACI85U_002257, partial [Candidatus Promineifilaceae bacterium]